MAKKRGGLAGIYDRNKGLIQKAVPAALSFIPGAGIPLAAAAGAAMRGLDRPGKAGIGFDPFAALKGGVEGYAVGQGTQALAGGVKGLLTAGMKSPLDTLAAPDMASQIGMTPGSLGGMAPAPVGPDVARIALSPGTPSSVMPTTAPTAAPSRVASKLMPKAVTPPAASGGTLANPMNQPMGRFSDLGAINSSMAAPQPSAAALTTPMSQPMGRFASPAPVNPMMAPRTAPSAAAALTNQPNQPMGRFAGFMDTARKNKDLIGMGVKGLLEQMPNAASSAAMMTAEANKQRVDLEQQQMEEENRRYQAELDRRRRVAELLMPYAQQTYGSILQRQG